MEKESIESKKDIINSFKTWFLNNFEDFDYEQLNNILGIEFYLIHEIEYNYLERFNQIYLLRMISSKCSNEVSYIEHLLGPENYLILKYNNRVYNNKKEKLKYFYLKFSILIKKVQLYFTDLSKNKLDLKDFISDFNNIYKEYSEFLFENENEIIKILEKESIKVLKDKKKEEKFEGSVFN